jgi:hypothetical protein
MDRPKPRLFCCVEPPKEKHMRKKQILFTVFSVIPLIPVAGCAAPRAVPTQTPTFTLAPSPTLSPTPAFPLPEGIVIFDYPPDKKIPGHAYGQGATAIILANMSYGGERQWDPFVKAVDKTKFTTITFSYLQPDYIGASLEIDVLLEQLKTIGYQRVVCIGASLGVTACGSIAREPEMIGLVMIAGPNLAGSLLDLSYPKLFIAGGNDSWAASIQADYDNASDPRQLIIYPDIGLHGTELFQSKYGDQFLQTLIDFVDNVEQA